MSLNMAMDAAAALSCIGQSEGPGDHTEASPAAQPSTAIRAQPSDVSVILSPNATGITSTISNRNWMRMVLEQLQPGVSEKRLRNKVCFALYCWCSHMELQAGCRVASPYVTGVLQ